MPEFSELRASRKADREVIFAAFKEVLERHVAEYERKDEPAHVGWSGPAIEIRGSLNGVGFMVDIDDLHERHGSKGGLLSWFNANYPVRDFASGFNAAVRDFGQARPHHKASSIGDWAQLVAALDAGLALASEGAAFLERKAV